MAKWPKRGEKLRITFNATVVDYDKLADMVVVELDTEPMRTLVAIERDDAITKIKDVKQEVKRSAQEVDNGE